MNTKLRKEKERENRKQVILDAAETIMQANGLHGLNIDLIAGETQLAKGTIYLYFKSKEEILSMLTIKARNLLILDFQKIERSKESNIGKLKNILKANYLFYKRNPLYYDLVSLYEVNNQLTETEEMLQSNETIMKIVVGIAAKAKDDGSLNPNINLFILPMSIWGMAVGMMQLIKVRGNNMKEKLNISEQALVNTYLELLENGVKK